MNGSDTARRSPLVAALDRFSSWRAPASRLGDGLVLLLVVWITLTSRGSIEASGGAVLSPTWRADNALLVAAWVVAALVGLHLTQLYASTRMTTWRGDVYGIVSGLSVASMLALTVNFLADERSVSRLLVALLWLTGIVGLSLWRLLSRLLLRHLRRHGVARSRLLLVGGGPMAGRFLEAVDRQPDLGYEVVGYLDAAPDTAPARWLGGVDLAEALVARLDIHEVIIAGHGLPHGDIMTLIALCRRAGIPLKVLPDIYEQTLTHAALEQIEHYPVVCLTQEQWSWQDRVKRTMDLALASVALLALAPLCLGIALLVRRDSPGPILFRQTRVGRHGRLFTLYKFRSMVVDAERQLAALRAYSEVDGPIFKMRDDPRVTRVGRWLRRASLDEVPQLLNVIRGDMSLVGPRPPVPDEVAQYTPAQRARLEITPGITGLWQVSGRSQLGFDDMVRLDLDYARRRSVLLDCLILLRTIPAVLSKRGAF